MTTETPFPDFKIDERRMVDERMKLWIATYAAVAGARHGGEADAKAVAVANIACEAADLAVDLFNERLQPEN